MRDPTALPRFLLDLSFLTRLFISIISVAITLFLFTSTQLVFRQPIIFIIPVTLVAWMFKNRGLLVCIIILLITLWLYYSIQENTLFLPWMLVLYFIIGTASLLVIGLFVGFQRNAFDLVDEAQWQLAVAYEQQHKLNQIKDQFLQNVNHELRTPLTAIYGYLELLLVHDAQIDASMRVTFLEHAMQSCDELQLLINNVLDSMGIESQKKLYNTDEMAILDIVHEVLERFDPKTLQEHIIKIDIAEYIVVSADAQYTRQVIRNLLSNAFKYAPNGTQITISAALYGRVVQPLHPAPEICICIKDNGPGIPKEEMALLFGQFVRLRRDTSGSIRGSGLGLYLSKQFVESMGGRIWAESEGIPGKGSSFCFTLPCVPRPKIKAQRKNTTTYYSPSPLNVQTT